MEIQTKKLIEDLAEKITVLEQPIHLLAVCTGGMTLAQTINEYLRKKGIESAYFEVWTNTVEGKREIWKTTFHPEDYTGTAVIVEDVIWKGGALPSISKMLEDMKPGKKFYIISLLDVNKKADFSILN
jgi:hypoxanthine phosphoribosyltransferase